MKSNCNLSLTSPLNCSRCITEDKSVETKQLFKMFLTLIAYICYNVPQKQRDLENRLDKSNLKCREAEHIQKTYLQIKMKLEDEQKSFENTLDGMELDIVRWVVSEIKYIFMFLFYIYTGFKV